MDCTEKIPMELKEPIQVNGEWRTGILVSCGRCASCIMTRKAVWGFRMKEEAKRAKTAYFVTLTYDPLNVPYDKYGNKVLVKTDLQKFFKRLRQHNKRGDIQIEHLRNGLTKEDKIKYFACGEYGEQKGRPHYHAIIFNTTERAIYDSWTKGDVMTAKANKATIAYVMKYLDKLQDGQKKDAWKRPAEFQLQSKDIGTGYIDRMKHWHKANLDVQYMTDEQGIKYPIPESFKRGPGKLFTEDERMEILRIVNESLEESRQNLIDEAGPNAPGIKVTYQRIRKGLILNRQRKNLSRNSLDM